jgi:hypothetical protein
MDKAFKNKVFIVIMTLAALFSASCDSDEATPTSPEGSDNGDDAASMIIDHGCCDIAAVPRSAIQDAIDNLHIAYGHTSHGQQLITGMDSLAGFLGDDLYRWSEGGAGGTLDIDDYAFGSWGTHDLGAADWAWATGEYLDANPDVNVVIWSWCGQVSTASEQYIDDYLSDMTQLENDYPGVSFVYMTGHLDGSREVGNLHIRNEQIRAYCREGDKILYDFADIESYDPDGVYYLPMRADDGCNYDGDDNGSMESNWAVEWQNANPGDWYDCPSAHSQPLNANLKAYAAWHLWARLGGWDGD